MNTSFALKQDYSVSQPGTIWQYGTHQSTEMDICYYFKLLKYQPLVDLNHQLGYNCKLITLIFVSLGHVHKNVVRGMQLGGLQKKEAKRLCFSQHRERANMETEMLCLSLMC